VRNYSCAIVKIGKFDWSQNFLKHHLSREIPVDSNLPAANLLRQLLLDEHFLRLIPLKVRFNSKSELVIE
jgi:hypothetical protein